MTAAQIAAAQLAPYVAQYVAGHWHWGVALAVIGLLRWAENRARRWFLVLKIEDGEQAVRALEIEVRRGKKNPRPPSGALPPSGPPPDGPPG